MLAYYLTTIIQRQFLNFNLLKGLESCFIVAFDKEYIGVNIKLFSC